MESVNSFIVVPNTRALTRMLVSNFYVDYREMMSVGYFHSRAIVYGVQTVNQKLIKCSLDFIRSGDRKNPKFYKRCPPSTKHPGVTNNRGESTRENRFITR